MQIAALLKNMPQLWPYATMWLKTCSRVGWGQEMCYQPTIIHS